MVRRLSLAAARDHFTGIVREVEQGSRVELTRRGGVVAVLLSAREFKRLESERPSFREAFKRFLSSDPVGIAHADLVGLRERRPPRKVTI